MVQDCGSSQNSVRIGVSVVVLMPCPPRPQASRRGRSRGCPSRTGAPAGAAGAVGARRGVGAAARGVGVGGGPGVGAVGAAPPATRARPSRARRASRSPSREARAGADALVGPAVGEAGEHPGDLLEGRTPRRRRGSARPAGRRAGRRRAALADSGVWLSKNSQLTITHRREVAGRVALDPLEGDPAVVGGLVVADAEVVADRLVEDLVAAHDRAQRVGADADGVLAVGVALVLRVEGRDAGDLGRGQVEHVGAELDAAPGDVALLALHEVQQRQQRRPGLRVARDHLLRRRRAARQRVGRVGAVESAAGRARGVGGRHQRSTPPITGSIEATATMTSATWPPSHIAAVACRLLKDGSRKCAR